MFSTPWASAPTSPEYKLDLHLSNVRTSSLHSPYLQPFNRATRIHLDRRLQLDTYFIGGKLLGKEEEEKQHINFTGCNLDYWVLLSVSIYIISQCFVFINAKRQKVWKTTKKSNMLWTTDNTNQCQLWIEPIEPISQDDTSNRKIWYCSI